jgi:hypothetical protein
MPSQAVAAEHVIATCTTAPDHSAGATPVQPASAHRARAASSEAASLPHFLAVTGSRPIERRDSDSGAALGSETIIDARTKRTLEMAG